MDDLSFDTEGARVSQNGVVMLDESRSAVWFKREPKFMEAKSGELGREVWEERDFVYVQQPGERDAVKREVTPVDHRRWPKQWAAYIEGRKDAPDGTLISVIFPKSPAMAKNLEALGIQTVEQLAGIADSALVNIPFGGELKRKAQSYLDAVKGSEGFNKLQAELDRKQERIAALELQMANMQEQMTALAKSRDDAGATGSLAAPGGGVSPEMLATIVAAVQAATPQKRGPGRPPLPKEE